jgi:virginiamycin B lyase
MARFSSMQLRMAIVAGLGLASAGCYRDLDYGDIKCDINAKPACPDGFQCSAGVCVKVTAVDALVTEAGPVPSVDMASIDQVVAVDQGGGLDVAKSEALPLIDALPMVDASLDSGADVVTEIDGSFDAPQLSLDTGGLDSASLGVDADDAATVDVGGIDVGGVDAEWHPIDEFAIPTKSSNPFGLARGTDGFLWFCESDGKNIGRINALGDIKEFPISNGCSGAIVVGSDKNIWFADGGNVARLVPLSGEVIEFPTSSGYTPQMMTTGPDGNVWYTNSVYGKLGKVTPSGQLTEYSVKNDPAGILTGPDGNLWYAGYGVIVRIDAVESYTEFPVPKINGQGSVMGMTVGGDGRFWYTYNDFNHRAKVGAMTLTGTTIEYVVSELAVWPSSITTGPDGTVWFTDAEGIARITPSGQVTVFALPTSTSAADSLTVGPDGNLWFVDRGTNKIGRMRL